MRDLGNCYKKTVFLFLFGALLFAACQKKAEPPTVTTGDAFVSIDTKSVVCEGKVVDDGGSNVFDRGICYVQGEGVPTLSSKLKSGGSGMGEFSATVGNVDWGKYSYRAYASNDAGTAYGELRVFELTDLPSVTTGGFTLDIPTLSAVCDGKVTGDGGSPLSATGICYVNGSRTPTLNDKVVLTDDTASEIHVTLTKLAYKGKYSYRAFATNGRGTAYGETKTIDVPAKLPTVTTGEATLDVNWKWAVCKGTVTSGGATALKETGICYVFGSGTPTINNRRVKTSGAAKDISVTMSNLTLGNTYSWCAYATNEAGTSYGAVKTFTMPNEKATVVTLGRSFKYSTGYCNLYGVIIKKGDGDIIQKGICIMEGDGTPTIKNSYYEDYYMESDTIQCYVPLKPNTKYSYRAFVTNPCGTSYGEVKKFTTGSSVASFGSLNFKENAVSATYYSRYWYFYFSCDPLYPSFAYRSISLNISTLSAGSITGTALSGSATQYDSWVSYNTYYSTNPSGSVSSIQFYDSNGVYWHAKSFTLNITQLDTVKKRISFTLNAVMYNTFEAYMVEGGKVGLQSASTQNLTMTATNVELFSGKDPYIITSQRQHEIMMQKNMVGRKRQIQMKNEIKGGE